MFYNNSEHKWDRLSMWESPQALMREILGSFISLQFDPNQLTPGSLAGKAAYEETCQIWYKQFLTMKNRFHCPPLEKKKRKADLQIANATVLHITLDLGIHSNNLMYSIPITIREGKEIYILKRTQSKKLDCLLL